LIDRGASAIISWNVLVELSQTDKAVTFLLKELCVKQLNLKQAVETTMSQVGPDPKYGAKLLYYPSEKGNLSVKDLKATVVSEVILRLRLPSWLNAISSIDMLHKNP